ncbi:MAG: hypothetical protein AAGH64_00535 [Planctomycetota bacterium]
MTPSRTLVCLCVIALAVPLTRPFAARAATHDPRTTPAASLPLLGGDGVRLYVQEAYEGFSPAVTRAVAGRYAELVEAGMDNARHLFDWSDLQPEIGEVDTGFVREAMRERTRAGIAHQFVNITVVDTAGPESLPGFVNELLEAGVAWDDPRIVVPFTRVLDEVVPIALEHGAYMIGFANEPGSYYEEEPVAAASFTRFVEAAIAHTRTISDELATTVVFAGVADAGVPELMPLIDVASFNHYAYALETDTGCEYEGFRLPHYRSVGSEAIGPILDEMVRAAGGRLVCIQEFGQATGWNDAPATLGDRAGLALQREVMVAFAEELAARSDRFRTVCLWTLNDHTREGMAWVYDAIVSEGLPPCYAQNIAEIFGPTGLVRSDERATKKPAFDAVRDAIATLRERGGSRDTPARD